MGFGRAGLYFWYELPGRLRVTGPEVSGRGRSGPQKSQPEPSLLCTLFHSCTLKAVVVNPRVHRAPWLKSPALVGVVVTYLPIKSCYQNSLRSLLVSVVGSILACISILIRLTIRPLFGGHSILFNKK